MSLDPYVYVRLCFPLFYFGREKPHENVVFDPGIYVAEKEGCLFESETRSLGFLAAQKGGTRDMNMARISPLENSLLPKAFTLADVGPTTIQTDKRSIIGATMGLNNATKKPKCITAHD